MRVRVLWAVVCGSVAIAAPGLALDITIPAKVGLIKPGKLAKLVSKSPTSFTLPTAGGAQDPTLGGAELTLFDTVLEGAGTVTVTLGSAGWSGLGNPAGSKGYKYKGKDDPGSPCSVVLIKEKVIKAICKGTAVALTPPFDGDLGINVAIPAGTTAALRYCAVLGGTDLKNDATQLKRKDALAPAECAEIPAEPEFDGFDPNDVVVLSDDALAGRNNNTPGSIAAQDYLIDELQAVGIAGLGAGPGDAAYKQPFVQSGSTGTNILGVIPGTDLANEYIVVGGHYDHVGSCANVQVGDTVCNGATDNAAGTAAVLGIARGIAALPTPPRRSVIFAFWDAEEDGLRGSLYYTNNPMVPLVDTKGYINYDIQGANLLPSLRDFTFAVGAETGIGLGALTSAAASTVDFDERQLSFIFGQARSDYVNFVAVNVPTVFYSDSTGPCYHTNADEPAVVDFVKLEKQTRRGYELALALADVAVPPVFVAPVAPLANYGDAVILDEVLTAGLNDLGLFAPADQAALSNSQSIIHQLVLDGPGAFDAADVNTLLGQTIAVIDVLTRTTCDGFLAP